MRPETCSLIAGILLLSNLYSSYQRSKWAVDTGGFRLYWSWTINCRYVSRSVTLLLRCLHQSEQRQSDTPETTEGSLLSLQGPSFPLQRLCFVNILFYLSVSELQSRWAVRANVSSNEFFSSPTYADAESGWVWAEWGFRWRVLTFSTHRSTSFLLVSSLWVHGQCG